MMIEADRIKIQAIPLQDIARFSEYRDKEEVAEYQSWDEYPLNKAINRIEYCQKHPFHGQIGNYQFGLYIKENNQEQMLAQIVSLCTGRLEKYGNYDFFQNIQVLSPTKKGMLGTKELNKILQEKLNPNINKEPEKASMGAIFRTGDRVMQIKNNYDINWERKLFGEKEIGSGVFNGEIGTILKVDEKEKQIEIKFDDEKIAKYEFSDLDQIEHSYAITIHKAQRK